MPATTARSTVNLNLDDLEMSAANAQMTQRPHPRARVAPSRIRGCAASRSRRPFFFVVPLDNAKHLLFRSASIIGSKLQCAFFLNLSWESD